MERNGPGRIQTTLQLDMFASEGSTGVCTALHGLHGYCAELDAALAGVEDDADPVETIAALGARLNLQQALEAEVGLFLGRAR